MKRIPLIIIALALACGSASAFGAREHAAIAVIAENHLSPRARAAIREITGGERLALYASHPDKFRSDYLYEGEKIPHTYHVDADYRPDTDIKTSTLGGIDLAVKGLRRYRTTDRPDSTVLYLAYLVHYVGDMHCPSHVNYAKGTTPVNPKTYTFKANGKQVAFHKAWDSEFSAFAFNGGPADLAFLADTATPKEIKEYQRGTPYDWAVDNARFCFDFTRDAGSEVDRNAEVDNLYLQKHAEYVKVQIMKAGYRLAAMLNSIFK